MTDPSQLPTPAPEAKAPAAPPAQRTLAHMVREMVGEMQRALPRHMDADRMARLATTLLRKTPKLALSTPDSFFGSLLTASALGLEPGIGGECWLIPREDRRRGTVECTFQVGYQGALKLFYQHPMAKRVDSGAVHANDDFAYSRGLVQRLEHHPAVGDRGEFIGAWCLAELTTGALSYEYMDADRIAQIRGVPAGQKRDVADPEHWMERKTVLLQVLKTMPRSIELTRAMTVDSSVGSMTIGKAVAAGEPLGEIDYATGEVLA